MSCSCVPSNGRRDIASGEWKRARKEEALGYTWLCRSYGCREEGAPETRVGSGWPEGFSDDIRPDHHSDVLDVVGGRNDYLSPEMLFKHKERKNSI